MLLKSQHINIGVECVPAKLIRVRDELKLPEYGCGQINDSPAMRAMEVLNQAVFS